MSKDEQKLVAVYKAAGELEAQVIKGLLDSCNIPCFLKGEAVGNIYGLTVDGLGEVKVMVRESDAEAAREIIKEQKCV